MEIAIIGGLITVILVFFVIAMIRRGRNKLQQQEKARAAAEEPRDPFASSPSVDPTKISLGDVIDYLNQTYAVRGSVVSQEDSYGWSEFLLETPAGQRRWLGVERDGDLIVTLWEDVKDNQLAPMRTVTYDGAVYQRLEAGNATYRCTGTTDLQPEQGRLEYVDYKSPDGRLLSMERYNGGKWEMSIGSVIHLPMLHIYPSAAR